MADMNKILCNVQQILTPAQQLQARKNIGAFGNDNVAPEYDPEATYPIIGTPCMHDGVLYRSKVEINTAEDWTEAHWERSSVVDLINSAPVFERYYFRAISKYRQYIRVDSGGYPVDDKSNKSLYIELNCKTHQVSVSGSFLVTQTFTPVYSSSDGGGYSDLPLLFELAEPITGVSRMPDFNIISSDVSRVIQRHTITPLNGRFLTQGGNSFTGNSFSWIIKGFDYYI